MEVPDADWVHLKNGFRHTYLWHDGTGECVSLPGHWELEFDDGFAWISHSGDAEECWAGDKFTSTLHSGHREATGREELLVATKADDAKWWRQDVLERDNLPRVKDLQDGEAVLPFEAFVSKLPRAGFYVRWSAPYILNMAIGEEHDGRWMCTHMAPMNNWVLSMGWRNTHVRRSWKSVIDGHRSAGTSLDVEQLHLFDREYAFSTIGAVVVACHTSLDTTRLDIGEHNARLQSRRFLQALACTFMNGVDRELHIESGAVYLNLQLRGARVSLNRGSKHAAQTVEHIFKDKQHVDIAEFLIELYALRNTWRLGNGKRNICRACFKEITDRLHAEVEASKDDEAWGMTSHIALPELRREANLARTRVRRTPIATMMQIPKAISAQHGIRTASQFLAAREILRKSRWGTKAKVAQKRQKNARRGRNFTQTRCLQYNATSLRDLRHAKHGWFAVDGLRAANVEILKVAVGDPASKLHAWAVPKAPGKLSDQVRFICIFEEPAASKVQTNLHT